MQAGADLTIELVSDGKIEKPLLRCVIAGEGPTEEPVALPLDRKDLADKDRRWAREKRKTLLARVESLTAACTGDSPREPRLRELMKLGRWLRLWVPRSIRRAIDDALVGRRLNEPFWIHLRTVDPLVQQIPWETATLGLGKDIVIVRQDKAPGHGLKPRPNPRVLLIIDEKSEEGHARNLYDRSRESEFDVARPLTAEQWPTVSECLSGASRWDVIVYIGHMPDESHMSFGGKAVSVVEFAKALSTQDDLQCILLLGCCTWSQAASELIARGVPSVVGMHFPVDFAHLRKGLEAFLSTLAETGQLDDAFLAVKRAWPEFHQATPVLHLSGAQAQLLTCDRRLAQRLRYARTIREHLSRLPDMGLRIEGKLKDLYLERHVVPATPRPVPTDGVRGGSTSPGETEPAAQQPVSQEHLLAELRLPLSRARFCVTGPAGSGKSALLRQLAWELARAFINDPDSHRDRLPILISLRENRDWLKDNLEGGESVSLLLPLIHRCAAKLGLVDRRLVEQLLRDGRVVLLMDGLDEVRPVGLREQLVERLLADLQAESVKDCPVIVAGRPEAVDRSDLPAFRQHLYKLQGLGTEDVKRYIKCYFALLGRQARGADLLSALARSPELQRCVTMPLRLVLLCELSEEENPDPTTTEDQLLGASLQRLFRRRDIATADEQEAHRAILSRLAWQCEPGRESHEGLTRDDILKLVADLHGDVRYPWIAGHIDRTTSQLTDKPEGVIDWLCRTGVLIEDRTISSARYVICDDRMGEFLAKSWSPRKRAGPRRLSWLAAATIVLLMFVSVLSLWPPPAVCESDANCDNGQTCDHGTCAPGPSTCRNDADCPAGKTCYHWACVAVPPRCTTDSECPSGEVCHGGTCVPGPPDCQSDAECPSGQVCKAGTCVTEPQCIVNGDCPVGEICDSGTCVAGPPDCQSDAECPSGQVCKAGTCVTEPQCIVNGDCPVGEICDRGTCVAGPLGCRNDDDCEPQKICVNRSCVDRPLPPVIAGTVAFVFTEDRNLDDEADPQVGGICRQKIKEWFTSETDWTVRSLSHEEMGRATNDVLEFARSKGIHVLVVGRVEAKLITRGHNETLNLPQCTWEIDAFYDIYAADDGGGYKSLDSGEGNTTGIVSECGLAGRNMLRKLGSTCARDIIPRIDGLVGRAPRGGR